MRINIIDNFYSPKEDTTRTLRIGLPESYDSSDKKYPVLYMFDGQNIFSDHRSALYHTWCVNPALEQLYAQKRLDREWIVVGIDHRPDRFDEYTPWDFPGADIYNPHGRRTIDVIVEDIIPYINKNYRTLTTPQDTALAGASLGGLMALYAARIYPNVIGRYGAFSPTIMWSDYKLYPHWDKATGQWTKIYMDTGSEEVISVRGVHLDYPRVTNEFYQHLRNLGYEGYEVAVVTEQGAIHHEIDWARRFPEAAAWFLQ